MAERSTHTPFPGAGWKRLKHRDRAADQTHAFPWWVQEMIREGKQRGAAAPTNGCGWGARGGAAAPADARRAILTCSARTSGGNTH